MISAHNISKYYSTQKVLDQVNFTAKKGKILGLLGPNGAGKSTLIKILTGYLAADEGEVRIGEQTMHTNRPDMQHLIGYLPEHNPLYVEMYVKEYLRYVAGIYRVSPRVIPTLIKRVGLTSEQHKKISQLSKGYRQRVGLAQALVHSPDFLIFDEPTTGLDPNQIMEVRELIKHVAQEKTVLLSTHLMQEVNSVCDEVLILNKGKVVANSSVEDILKTSRKGQRIRIEFLQTIDTEALKEAIPSIQKISETGERKFLLDMDSADDCRVKIAEFAGSKGWTILMMQRQDADLGDIFAQLTKSSL